MSERKPQDERDDLEPVVFPEAPGPRPAQGHDGEAKTAKETATPQAAMPVLVPQPNGKGALLSGGMPGNAGGGRPRDEFKAWLEGLMDDPDNRRVFETYLKAGNMKAWAIALKYTKSLPAQEIDAIHRIILEAVRE